jgi:hypothetical protein
MVFRVLVLASVVTVAISGSAQAQTLEGLEGGATFVTTGSGQFHTRDIGVGGWLAWRLHPLVNVEGELTYHADPFGDAVSFSAGRVEGLFGATVGPRLGVLRPFASLRPGFVKYRAADEPIACIASFPPPLSCTLANGRTVFAFDAGGGVEVSPTRRSVIRLTVSDRMVRYASAAIDTSGVQHDNGFAGHDLRFAFGIGVQF